MRPDLAVEMLDPLDGIARLRQQVRQTHLASVRRLAADVITANGEQIEGDELHLNVVPARLQAIEVGQT